MTIKSLKTAGKIDNAAIEAINDRVHRLALLGSLIDHRVFLRKHRESDPRQIYLTALTGDCSGVKGLAFGFSVVSNDGGRWIKITTGYTEKLTHDADSNRRMTALKGSLRVTRDEYRPPLKWTDFLYQNPEYYDSLLTVLDYTIEQANMLSVVHPQHRSTN